MFFFLEAMRESRRTEQHEKFASVNQVKYSGTLCGLVLKKMLGVGKIIIPARS